MISKRLLRRPNRSGAFSCPEGRPLGQAFPPYDGDGHWDQPRLHPGCRAGGAVVHPVLPPIRQCPNSDVYINLWVI